MEFTLALEFTFSSQHLKNNRCRKFQSLTDIDKGSSVLKDEVCTASGAVLFFCGTHLFAKSKFNE